MTVRPCGDNRAKRLGSEGQQVISLDEVLKMLTAEAVPPDLKRL